ncbi:MULTISPECIES: ATP-dependent helicase HrpA [unclassified Pseudomonas]|nr:MULTISPECIES: ATP-dependent helicase HrpA [unclassified Pseudomonas]
MGASLGASMAAMQQLDATSAATTAMNAKAQSTKMVTDTVNSISQGAVDSATKATSGMTEAAKSIRY